MADTLEYTSSGSGERRTLADPDDLLVRRGLPSEAPVDTTDPQTGRTKKAVAISTRSRAAAALRVSGASYAEVADALEYPSAAHARAAVELVLASTVDETRDYQSLRALASLRLEGLLKAVVGPATDEENPDQLGFHRAAVSVVDRWIKLHGLDAPQRLTVINPSSEEFEQVVGAMMALTPGQHSAEADIFALDDVVEAEWEDADAPTEDAD